MNYREKIDFSSLSTYMDCPRKFLFQYMLHFRSDNKNLNLVFGSCYHYGLEEVYKNQMTNPGLSELDAATIAADSFKKLWKLEGSEAFPDEDIIFPKSPGHAINMFYKYFKRYLKADANDYAVVAVEEPFSIDLSELSPALPSYIGRIDLIWQDKRSNLMIADHKASKAIYPITLPGFEVSFQTDGYLSAGHLFYDKNPSMLYNIHLCQKAKIDFQRFIIHKRKAALEQFFQDVGFYLTRLTRDLDLFEQELATKLKRDDHIECFRRNPGSACTTYMSPCRYKQICMIRNNPLLWVSKPPQGFQVNEWDPELHEAETKAKLEEVA